MADSALEIRYKSRKFRRGELADIVKELPRRLRAPALNHVAQFYLKKFRLYPRYKWVTRARAYGMQAGGPGFFSDKQRRKVFAMIRSGEIAPGKSNRTMAIKNAWHIEGRGVSISLVNSEPGAVFLYDPILQARQTDLVGWKDVNEMNDEWEDDAVEDLWEYVIDLADKQLENIMTGK
jgi:hypothetical protein